MIQLVAHACFSMLSSLGALQHDNRTSRSKTSEERLKPGRGQAPVRALEEAEHLRQHIAGACVEQAAVRPLQRAAMQPWDDLRLRQATKMQQQRQGLRGRDLLFGVTTLLSGQL